MSKPQEPTNDISQFVIKNNTVIISIHESTHGPGHDLRDLLVGNKIKRLLFIAHPLLFLPSSYKNSSRFELYENGKKIKEGFAIHWVFPEPFLYIKDVLYSLWWSFLYMPRVHVFFGIGNLNALVGVLLKQIKRAEKSVYYVIDFVPNRFTNRLINIVYHTVEKIAAQHSTYTWNLSERMIKGREKKWRKKFYHQLIVPHGVHFDRIKRIPFEKINKYEILFMGALLEKQGIQLVLESLPELIAKIPKITFTIIGRGPYEEEIKGLVMNLKLEKYVTFLGYIESHEEMENRIAKSSIAVALYDRLRDISDFTYYADPGKIKNYLGAGVPVIMTNVPLIAQQVAIKKCGFIVEYNKESLVSVLLSYFLDTDLMQEYRKNAVKFAKQYDWGRVFGNALSYLN